MKTLLKDLYNCFYTPPEFSEQKQEVEECHQALIKALESRNGGWCFESWMPESDGRGTLHGQLYLWI